jgi:threonine/homoserine/homoserine lactone efflux protein
MIDAVFWWSDWAMVVVQVAGWVWIVSLAVDAWRRPDASEE